MWVTQEGEMSQSPNVHLARVEYANGTEGMGLRLRRGCKRGEVVGPGLAWVACGAQQYVATKYEQTHQRVVNTKTPVWEAAMKAYAGEQSVDTRSKSDAVAYSWLDPVRENDCDVMGFGVVQPRDKDMLVDRSATQGKAVAASFIDEAATDDQINCMWDTRLNAYILLRDIQEEEWAYTTYGSDPLFKRTWEVDREFGDKACDKFKWKETLMAIKECLQNQGAIFNAAVKSLQGVLVNTAEKKGEAFCLLAAPMDVAGGVAQALLADLGAKGNLMQNEHSEGIRRRAQRELDVNYCWNAKARDSIGMKGPLSEYEGMLMAFCDDSVLHATGVMAHPVVRCMLAKGLQKCTSVEDEEDVLYHYKAVLGMLSRMCVPLFRYDSGVTVTDWMKASVPEHVRRTTAPMGRDKTYRDKCAVLEAALRGASLASVGAGRKLVTAWTCALYAGVVHASWLMEAGINRANVEDIYPDGMAEAIPYVRYHSNYSSLFTAMQVNALVPPGLVMAIKGDSQLINTMESMMYVHGIVGSNGEDGTVAPWTRMLNWMLVGVGDWDWRVDKHWQKTITKKLEEEVKTQYFRSGADDADMARGGWGWITKVWEPNSKKLEDTMFFCNTGPRVDQRIKVFNVQHLKSLYDVLAKGAKHARAPTYK